MLGLIIFLFTCSGRIRFDKQCVSNICEPGCQNGASLLISTTVITTKILVFYFWHLRLPSIVISATGLPDFRIRGADCSTRGADCNIRGVDCNIRGADCNIRGADCNIKGAD